MSAILKCVYKLSNFTSSDSPTSSRNNCRPLLNCGRKAIAGSEIFLTSSAKYLTLIRSNLCPGRPGKRNLAITMFLKIVFLHKTLNHDSTEQSRTMTETTEFNQISHLEKRVPPMIIYSVTLHVRIQREGLGSGPPWKITNYIGF